MTYKCDEKDDKNEESQSDKSFEILKKTRTLVLCGEINQKLAERITSQLIMLDSLSDEPIKILINSQGGHVEAGDTIHDMIRFVNSKVIVIGTGWVASAGIIIYLAAEKENRYSLPNTRYLIHQPSGGVYGQASDIQIEATEIVRMRERLNKIISKATGQKFEKVVKDGDRNFWLSAEEAKEYGVVNKIITKLKEIV